MTKSKTSFPLLSLLLCSSVLAAEGGASIEELNRKIDQLTLETVWGTKGAKTAPAIANPAGMGLFVFGDYLYWRSYENGVFQAAVHRSDNTFLLNPDVVNTDFPVIGDQKFLNETVRVNWDTNNSICVDADLSQVKFDFDSGYRVGLGWVTSSYEYWDIQAAFTQFTNRAHRSESFCCPSPTPCPSPVDSPYVFASVNSEQNPFFLNTDWKIHYYNLDLSIGRFFFLSKYLALRPYLGGRGSIINQRKDLQLQSAGVLLSSSLNGRQPTENIPYVEKEQIDDLCVNGAKNNFWGVGPLVGIEGKWFLTKNFNFYTVASASLMFGEFSLEEVTNITQQNTTIFDLDDYYGDYYSEGPLSQISTADFANCITQSFTYNPSSIVPSGRLGVGLEFNYPFKKDAYVASVRAGYEVEYYWRQNYLGSPTVLLTPDVADFDPTVFLPPGKIGPFFQAEFGIDNGLSFGQLLPVDGFVGDSLFLSESSQPIVMPNSPGDLAFHGLTVGISLGF